MKRRLPMRALKRGAPEEKIAPGESLEFVKDNHKVFRLTRTDDAPKDFAAYVEGVLAAVPLEGPRRRTDLVRAHLEEAE